MSQNILNDISKVYLEQVAVDEAVRGQDSEMRRAASAERQKERKERGGNAPKIPGKEGPSAGKTYADYQQLSIKGHDKATKGKHIAGYAYSEEHIDEQNAGPSTPVKFDSQMGHLVPNQGAGRIGAVRPKPGVSALKNGGKVRKEALDPVGKEDNDPDNDGVPISRDKNDQYIMKRRKAIGKAIATRKESFSNWRQDLSEVMDDVEDNKKIKEKKVENKIVINPELKEAVEELGGTLLEMVEIEEMEEAYKPIDKDKENKMYRRAGNLARTALSSRGKKKEEAQKKSSKIVSAITRQKENERFERIGKDPKHQSNYKEEVEIDEAMSSYDRNRKRAAERAAARNAARDAGKTGAVPGVGYVSPRREKETYVDSAGVTRHKSGARMPQKEEVEQIEEKAMSRAQQRFMGMVYAAKKGEKPASAEVAKAAEGMSKGEAKKFAKTKHKGLPEKKKISEQIGVDASKTPQKTPEKLLQKLAPKYGGGEVVRTDLQKAHYEPEGELVDEGMTMKDFKKQRSRQKQKDKREAEKTSPLRRAGIHADKASPERAARHRANVDPDFEGNDERNYPGGRLRSNKVRKAKALGELGESSEDRARDTHQERGGMAARVDYDRPPAKKLSNKELGIRDFTPAEKEARRKQMAAHLKKMRN